MSEFTEAIDRNWPDYTIAPGASRLTCCVSWADDEDKITDDDLSSADEGSFSWSGCDACGSNLGGNRYPAHAIKTSSFGKPRQNGDICHIDICERCLMFHANGEEPED